MADLTQLVRDLRARIAALQPFMSREEIAPQLNVTYSWLCKFMQEHEDAANPRVGTLDKVIRGLEEIERLPTVKKKKRNGATQ